MADKGFMARSSCGLLGIAIVLVLLVPPAASAYTDPGTGAMIWQLLMGAGLGALFYLRRIINWISGRVR
jgi:hypothetical protein